MVYLFEITGKINKRWKGLPMVANDNWLKKLMLLPSNFAIRQAKRHCVAGYLLVVYNDAF